MAKPAGEMASGEAWTPAAKVTITILGAVAGVIVGWRALTVPDAKATTQQQDPNPKAAPATVGDVDRLEKKVDKFIERVERVEIEQAESRGARNAVLKRVK